MGKFAVQVGKSFGAQMTGVSSTGNVEMVRFIGANRVIHCTQKDFTKRGQLYDIMFDCVGSHSSSLIVCQKPSAFR